MKRWAIVVRGVVQGVGFRPFVYHLAARHGLGGFVRNRTGTVLIEVEGEPSALDRFLAELIDRPPRLAQVADLSRDEITPLGDREFRVDASEDDGDGPVFVSPDVATCADCLAEMLDPGDRRHGYPFLNCTDCGPRLTIITGAPYDRRHTTMDPFAMCAACRAEYDDPRDRRFHAQPTACPGCGPQVRLLDASGQPIPAGDPLARFAEALLGGRIGALKGVGGYHLVCDARNAEAVAELRRRKHRDEKPFAVMVPDIESAASLAEIGPAERALLASPRGPIVLLRKRGHGGVAEGVAPANPWLGVMLPYSPLHHLLARAVGGIPLVMTSGNRSDEPIAHREDAVETLCGIADLFLSHDRAIHVRCDDSVTRVVDGVESPVRRSRGYAPQPISLPSSCARPILALGGQLKATFALGRGRQAFLSHHLGDLDHPEVRRAFARDVELYQQHFAIRPGCLVHDLHPDYATTRYALEQASREGQELLGVQHHHAHVASCMAEHGLDEPVLGVAFDGTGYGTDGAIWGGEFLVGDYRGFRRAAHLRHVRMPGGDRAIREPWRMALAHLMDAGASIATLEPRLGDKDLAIILKMLERGLHAPPTSSVGRLFDAVACLATRRDRVSYEGQAAAELEWLATGAGPEEPYPFGVQKPDDSRPSGASRERLPNECRGGRPGRYGPPVSGRDGRRDNPEKPALVIDTRPLIREVADDASAGVPAPIIAGRFHATLTEIVASTCGSLRDATGIDAVVLSGGVFQNAHLTRDVADRLARDGFRVHRHRLVPPNDGGLSLGQLAIAAALLR